MRKMQVQLFSKKGGNVVHSGKRNADGTYNNNAGILTTEYNVTLEGAARGLTDTRNRSNVEFVRKISANKALNTTLGTVDSRGVRVISDKKEIEQFLNQLTGND